MTRWILGIAGSHNSAAALIRDGRVVVAVQTERLVRQKRAAIRLDEMGADALAVVQYCLDHAGIDLPDLAAIATSTPWGWVRPSFTSRTASWDGRAGLQFVTVPHHLAHAEYALHYSPMEPCGVVVCDGSGTFERDRPSLDIQELKADAIEHVRGTGKESISAYEFDGRDLRLCYRVAYGKFPRLVPDPGAPDWLESVGHLWRWAAWYCHGSTNAAGKVMGLAPYGTGDAYRDLETLALRPDGEVVIGLPDLVRRCTRPNLSGADITGDAHYEEIAAHVQRVTNEFLVDLFRYLGPRVPSGQFCYSGGLALNSVANDHVERELGIQLHMNGSCEDNGTALGAALAAHHALTGERVAEPPCEYYGRSYDAAEIEAALRGFDGEVARRPMSEVVELTARELADGAVVGWFQGRGEFGPRALGNRSILADARREGMQDFINQHVKNREMFRPFAPVVLEERAHELFDSRRPSPMMLRVVPVTSRAVPAITHVDGTARLQTVNRAQNPLLHALITAFDAHTGVPVVLNTSYNVAGEPIVESPADALRTFVAGGLDLLVMGDFVVRPRPGSARPSARGLPVRGQR